MKSVTIILTAALFLFGLMSGCEKRGSSETSSEEVAISEKEILGKYINKENSQEYIELKKDGTVYMMREFPWGKNELSGKWKIEEDQLLLISPIGEVDRCRLKTSTIIDSDGKTWVREEKARDSGKTKIISEEKPLKSQIPGKYTVVTANRLGREYRHELWDLRENGTIANDSLSGKWIIKGDEINFYKGAELEKWGRISEELIEIPHGETFQKKEGTLPIKTLEILVYPETSFSEPTAPRTGGPRRRASRTQVTDAVSSIELGGQKETSPPQLKKITLWSDYASENKLDILKLESDETFLMEKFEEGKWRIKNGVLQLYFQEGFKEFVLDGKIEGETIIFGPQIDGSMLELEKTRRWQSKDDYLRAVREKEERAVYYEEMFGNKK